MREVVVVLVVGYDRHPASRAALVFAGELAGALNAPLHVVHVVDDADTAPPNSTSRDVDLDAECRHVADALGDVQCTYHRLRGDSASVLLQAARQHGASMLIVGRPEQGIGAAFGHMITGNVARNLLRCGDRPVVVVPPFGTVPR
ncbi:universal stress protein [Candidatus Mycobacterium methanotrophicum]|uniref:Universal stress protein n=1 Tax=Candidatus Mycobacterium methanotrophicum TaxID=2943498 RepID=A0ABY4QGV5_9MYCO|nr:universal stress protein [Candidatus Mycobacterium methanotrophicum]UQX09746.1 universal stress protein [Candidatus Mycobacterium methanotrophicum]